METALITELSKRMDGAIASLQHELKGLRTGRASPNLLDHIMVDAYGDRMPLAQLATISVPESRLLTVQVWDRGMTKAVEKAISEANLGLNPSSDGQLIRVPMPQLSEERRAEMVKVAHKYAEQSKVAIRNVRRDGMEQVKKMEKDGEIAEDKMHTLSDEVQKLTDQFIKQIDQIVAAKEQEIMAVS
jgi:ribosome recycling factor